MPAIIFFLSIVCVVAANVLLFSVQPIVGKILTPAIGGSPLVWNSVLVFFQLLMVLCYSLTWLTLRFAHRSVVRVLLLAMLIAGAWFSGPAQVFQGAEHARPEALDLLWLLASSLTMTLLPIGMTTSLLQVLTARARVSDNRSYSLSSVSNFAGLLVIVAFSVVADEFLGLRMMLRTWTSVDLVYRVCFGVTLTLLFFRAVTPVNEPDTASRLQPREFVTWLFASAVGSLILNVGTLQLGLLVPSVPLVWLPPLALYLLSFTIAFHPRFRYSRPTFLTLALCFVLGAVYGIPGLSSVVVQVLFFFGFLFSAMMLAHGELVATKPVATDGGRFFFAIGLGGALGGLCSQFLLPLIFNGFNDPVFVVIALVLLLFLRMVPFFRSPKNSKATVVIFLFVLFVPTIIADRKVYSGIDSRRNFFGITKVQIVEKGEFPLRTMVHNATVHGSELLDGTSPPEPTAYYHRKSAIGEILSRYHDGPPIRVGVVGLGAGTVSAYLKSADEMVYYEINPAVKDLALRWFHYISTSPAPHEFVIGDARQTLGDEQPRHFDVLLLDPFSGGSPPIHLLTAEAFQIYEKHVQPGGVLVAHISNNFLDLSPVFRDFARTRGYDFSLVSAQGDNRRGLMPSVYAVVRFTKNHAPDLTPMLWTDDFFPLLSLVKRNGR